MSFVSLKVPKRRILCNVEKCKKGAVMSDTENTVSRHEIFEDIRASELARGATEDDAARIAAERVDQVMDLKKAE